MDHRSAAFRAQLAAQDIDAAFILKPHNVFYFANYSSVCSGVLAFRDSDPLFCTLWLDAPEAKNFCTLPRVTAYRFPSNTLIGRMIALLQSHNSCPKRLGVEKDFMLVRDYEFLSAAFPKTELVHVSPLVDRLRAIKSEDEIDKIRKSADIADRAMEAALKAVRPGITEIDVAAEAEYLMRKSGSEKTAFSTFVASGPRTLLAHPVATARVIHAGEPVVIDLGATWAGYTSDICRTTFAGEAPTSAQVERLHVVIEAQQGAAALLREGALSGSVFDAAYRVFKKHNLAAWLPDDIGYGVGLRQSEFYPVIKKQPNSLGREHGGGPSPDHCLRTNLRRIEG